MENDRIESLILAGDILFSHHARIRMFENNVSTDDVIAVISSGEIIERYPDDEPCPSFLLLGFIDGSPYHLVVATCQDHVRVVTVYIPEENKWNEYRVRKAKL